MNMHNIGEILNRLGSITVRASGMTGPLLGILTYVFTALALYTMAERRGIRNSWMAWLPVLNVWVLGSLSDQYRYVVRGEIRSKRKALLTLNIISAVLSIVMICVAGVLTYMLVTSFFENASEAVLVKRIMGPCMTALGLLVPMLGIGIAYAVLRFVALYDIYRSCDPQNATLFLVLSIFIGITTPFFLFACRNKDDGMPPRRAMPQDEPPAWNDENMM